VDRSVNATLFFRIYWMEYRELDMNDAGVFSLSYPSVIMRAWHDFCFSLARNCQDSVYWMLSGKIARCVVFRHCVHLYTYWPLDHFLRTVGKCDTSQRILSCLRIKSRLDAFLRRNRHTTWVGTVGAIPYVGWRGYRGNATTVIRQT
jgi:hypothetical protein